MRGGVQPVAIKQLFRRDKAMEEAFIREIAMLKCARAPGFLPGAAAFPIGTSHVSISLSQTLQHQCRSCLHASGAAGCSMTSFHCFSVFLRAGFSTCRRRCKRCLCDADRCCRCSLQSG
jgi:hypothetical protein